MIIVRIINHKNGEVGRKKRCVYLQGKQTKPEQSAMFYK